MTAALSGFSSFMQSLFGILPALIQQLIFAVTGTFVMLGLLKMFRK